jgi:hypothetical protein
VNADHPRFPGFDVLAQHRHWDAVTAGVVLERVSNVRDFRFFTPDEQAVATVLCDRLLGQRGDDRIPIAAMIDARLAEAQTDGWRYADMPEDGRAWRDTLAALGDDAHRRYGRGFVDCSEKEQVDLIQAVQDLGTRRWHDLPADRVWSLWTRYACTAFYAHPDAWSEMGFPGPAYPRGYKNIGVDRREPFEVRDARPHEDPLR